MKPRLAKLLVCPDCLIPLELEVDEQQDDEIRSGLLTCPRCDLSFPIRGGIPRFVQGSSYAESFSFEWKRWRRTQLDSGPRRTSESTFVASTGREPSTLAGKLVLDAGCGPGRYVDVVSRSRAEVVGVDMSLAVEVARDNLGERPNCHFVQADLLHLPFAPGTFDWVYSIGVLHHTPDTHRAFLRLARVLRPGGEIAIWVYPQRRLAETFRYFPGQVNEVLAQDVAFRVSPRLEPWVRRFAGPLDWIMETSSRVTRAITTRLPRRSLYGLCHAAVPLYYVYRVPLFYPLRLVSRIAMDPDPEWRVLDTFDWYSPRFQWKHTYAEVEGWFKEAGLTSIERMPRPVAVRGARPQ